MSMSYTPRKGEAITANAGGTDFTVVIYGSQAPELPMRWAGFYSSSAAWRETVWHSVLGGVYAKETGRKRVPMMDVHFIRSFSTEAEALADCQRMCGEADGEVLQDNSAKES